MDKGGLNYRKEIWAILKEYEDSKDMSLEEALNKIMAIPQPGETKNPYEGMATRG